MPSADSSRPFPDGGVLRGRRRHDVWDTIRFSFIEEDSPAPDTVNPSLWRQSQLVLKGGLFKVTDRLYQVRNADLSNMTIVEGDTGLIIFDPLHHRESRARAALELVLRPPPRKAGGRRGPLSQPRRPLRRREGGRLRR